MFGNAPKELWQRWIVPDEKNRIPLACRALLIQTDDGRNILFEAGGGAFFEPKLCDRYGVTESENMLALNLKKLGIRPEEIDGVVLSHLHFDHAGGLLAPYSNGSADWSFLERAFILEESIGSERRTLIQEKEPPLFHSSIVFLRIQVD